MIVNLLSWVGIEDVDILTKPPFNHNSIWSEKLISSDWTEASPGRQNYKKLLLMSVTNLNEEITLTSVFNP